MNTHKIYKRYCSDEEWKEFITIMQSGNKFEIDEDMYNYWLDVIPPVFMNKYITFFPGYEGTQMKVDFGFAEGIEYIVIFWRNTNGDKFFGQRTNKINIEGME